MSKLPGSTSQSEEIIIRPPSELLQFDLREYYRYRHMFRALVWRNIRVQFDEVYLSFVWVWVRPLLYVLVFVAFRKLSNANVYVSIPYALYLYSGLILYYYFVESTMETAGALKSDAHLLTKVYFPRLITPMVPTVANLVNLGLSLIPMVVMMLWYGVWPSWRIVLLPLVVLQCMILIVGVGMIVAAITLTNRDWERFLSSVLYIGLFITPVIYAPEMIPEKARVIYLVNPGVGTLLAFRSTIFATETFPVWSWLYSVVFSLGVFILGVRIYRTAESQFADKL